MRKSNTKFVLFKGYGFHPRLAARRVVVVVGIHEYVVRPHRRNAGHAGPRFVAVLSNSVNSIVRPSAGTGMRLSKRGNFCRPTRKDERWVVAVHCDYTLSDDLAVFQQAHGIDGSFEREGGAHVRVNVATVC